jgi:hypothetical protein
MSEFIENELPVKLQIRGRPPRGLPPRREAPPVEEPLRLTTQKPQQGTRAETYRLELLWQEINM